MSERVADLDEWALRNIGMPYWPVHPKARLVEVPFSESRWDTPQTTREYDADRAWLDLVNRADTRWASMTLGRLKSIKEKSGGFYFPDWIVHPLITSLKDRGVL